MANAAPGDAIGAASIKLTLDTSGIDAQLQQVRQQLQGLSGETSRAARTPRGGGGGAPGSEGLAAARAQEAINNRLTSLTAKANALEQRGVDISRARLLISQSEEAVTGRRLAQYERLSQQASRLLKTTKETSDREDKQLKESVNIKRQDTSIQTRDQNEKKRAAAEYDKYETRNRREKRQAQREYDLYEAKQRRAALPPSQTFRIGGPAEAIGARDTASLQRFETIRRINALERAGVDVSRLRRQTGELTESISRREFGTAKQLTAELSRQVKLAQDKLKIQREEEQASARARREVNAAERRVATAERTEQREGLRRGRLNVSPVGGTTGQVDSPAYLAEVQRQQKGVIDQGLRIGRLNASPVRGTTGQVGSPAYLAEIQRQQKGVIDQGLRIGRLNASPVRGTTGQVGSPAYYEEVARQQNKVIQEGLRIGRLNASPIRGTTGQIGSPAYYEEVAKQQIKSDARIAEATKRNSQRLTAQRKEEQAQAAAVFSKAKSEAVPILGRQGDIGSPNQQGSAISINNKLLSQEGDILKLRERGVNTSKLENVLEAAREKLTQNNIKFADNYSKILQGQLTLQTKLLAAEKIRADNARRLAGGAAGGGAGGGGSAEPPFSFKESDARIAANTRLNQQRRNRQLAADRQAQREEERAAAEREREAKKRGSRFSNAASSALIGGGFPLLFGQGAGASVGGALGGAVGGLAGGGFGFGASIAGTAIGTAIDTLITRTKDLATALQDPIAAFEQLKQAGQFSSKGIETLIETLTASGRTALAAKTARTDLAGSLDPATALALSTTTDALNRSAAQLQNQLGQFLAGPAIGFNLWLQGVIEGTQRVPQNPLVKFLGDVYQSVIPLGIALKALGQEGKATQARVTAAAAPFEAPLAQNDTRRIAIQEQIIASKTQLSSLSSKEARDTAALLQFEERRAASDRRVTEARRARAALIAADPSARADADKSFARTQQAETITQKDIKAERLAAEREIGIERQRNLTLVANSEREILDKRLSNETDIAQRRREANTVVRTEGRERGALIGGQNLNATGQGALRAAAQYRNELEAAADAVTRIRENTARANAEAATAEANARANVANSPAGDPAAQQALRVAVENRINVEKRGAVEVAAVRDESNSRSETSAVRFRTTLIDGARSAKQEVLQIARSLEDSKLQLLQLQGTPTEGLNKFLGPQQRYDRTRAALSNIQGAVGEASRASGITPQFIGSIEQQLAQSIDFIRSARAEQRLTEDIGKQEQDLIKANNSLTEINTLLNDNTVILNDSIVNLVGVIANWKPTAPAPAPAPYLQ